MQVVRTINSKYVWIVVGTTIRFKDCIFWWISYKCLSCGYHNIIVYNLHSCRYQMCFRQKKLTALRDTKIWSTYTHSISILFRVFRCATFFSYHLHSTCHSTLTKSLSVLHYTPAFKGKKYTLLKYIYISMI